MTKDYVCGCGKTYGSYPAFSTHRKFKHQNITVPGSIIPAQEKAKRGRPSCDFKKIPQLGQKRKEFYQGLNLIEYGLLDLQEKYKGQILSEPHEDHSLTLTDFDVSDDAIEKDYISFVSMFMKIMTSHMQEQTSKKIYQFLKKLVQYGVQTKDIGKVQLFNNFCMKNIKSLQNCELGINFYIQICLLLSKWLCVVGVSKQLLKERSGSTRNL